MLPPASSASVSWDGEPSAEELTRLDGDSFSPAWGLAVYREFRSRSPVTCWVLRGGTPGEAVGWAVVQHVGGEAEVLRLGVRPPYRRQGWGTVLVEGVLDRLRALGVTRIYLEVREGNHAAQALYRAAGMQPVGRRPSYYQHPTEDAILMEWKEG